MNKRLILILSFLLSPLLHGSDNTNTTSLQAFSEMVDEKLLKDLQQDEEYLKLVAQANKLNAKAVEEANKREDVRKRELAKRERREAQYDAIVRQGGVPQLRATPQGELYYVRSSSNRPRSILGVFEGLSEDEIQRIMAAVNKEAEQFGVKSLMHP